MERKILNSLVGWKNQTRRKPLVLQGVRQCGKTYILKEFGEKHFSQYVYVNFEKDKGVGEIFDYDYDCKRILREISIIKGIEEIDVYNTLIIFDEIQECARAITSLKYFCEEYPGMYLAAAGSLLGPALRHKNVSFPVGKVTFMKMYPLSFEEFAIACGFVNEIELIQQFPLDREMPGAIASQLIRALKMYYVVGGMPEAVGRWIETHNMDEVDKILSDILISYTNDLGKYLAPIEALKAGWVWDSIPVQLAKENNKFMFSHVKKGKRSVELEDALEWLRRAELIFELQMVKNPQLPLSFNADTTYFKVYMCDIGLLRYKSGLSASTIIDETSLYSTFKGALTENFVMNELVKEGFSPYFWRSNNEAEVDFLIEGNEKVIPLEAKAEINTRAKSYAIYCKRYAPKVGFKVSMKNVGDNLVEQTHTYSLPLYLLWRLPKYI